MRVESHPERGVCVLAFAARRRQCVSPRRRQWTFWRGGFPELHCTRNCCQQARPPALDEPRQPRPHTTRIPTIHTKSRAALVLAGPETGRPARTESRRQPRRRCRRNNGGHGSPASRQSSPRAEKTYPRRQQQGGPHFRHASPLKTKRRHFFAASSSLCFPKITKRRCPR